MKKIFLLVLILSLGLIGKAQWPVVQNIGSDSTLISVGRNFGGGIKGNLINTSYSDTTAANLQRIRQYVGGQVFTTGDTSLWLRSIGANKWVKLAGAGGALNIANSNLTQTGNRILTGAGYYLAFDGQSSIRLQPSGLNRTGLLYIDYDSIRLEPPFGILTIDSLASGASTDSVLVWTQATGRVKKRSYSSFTPTWQQTLTAGSTLTGDNTIAGGGFSLEFGGNSTFSAVSTSGSNETRFFNNGTYSQIRAGNTTVGPFSEIRVDKDTLFMYPYNGLLKIDSLNNLSTQNTLLGWKQGTGQGQIGYVTLGSGLSLSSGVLNTSGTVPTPISSLTAATQTNSINNGNYTQTWNWPTLTSGALLINAASTAMANSGYVFGILNSGAHGSSGITTYSADILNTHTGTSSTNVALRLNASNATNNYSLITDGGNVGIGTSTPTSLLHVNGVAQMGTAGSTLGQILMSGNTSGTVTLKTAAAAGTWSLTLPTNDGDASQVLTTDGSGVTSWTTPSSGTVTGTGSANQVAYWTGASSQSGDAGMTYDATTDALTTGASVSTNYFYTGGLTGTYANYMGAKLGGTAKSALLDFYDNGTRIGEFYTDATSFNFFTDTGKDLIFYTNNSFTTPVIKASSGGNVGIGTASPSAKLHVVSTTEQLRVGYDASNYYSATVGSTGGVTFNAVGSGASFALEDRTTMTSARFQTAKGANVASAGDLTLGTDGNVFHITGTTTINAITTANWQAGSEITLIFDASVTVKHNTAGGGGTAVMILQGAADLAATANDVLKLVYDGTSWFCVSWSVN